MAAIDYYEIEKAIRYVLEGDPDLSSIGVKVLIESSLQNISKDQIIIYLERRDAPAETQTMSAGRRTRFQIRFSIWVFAFALNVEDACARRDDLLGKVEVALMKNRTLGDTVNGSWIEGGAFDPQPLEPKHGYVVGAEITLVADKSATFTGA